MKVVVQGGAKISLTQREFLAAGGEGSVYVSGGTAYKIYADPSKMIPEGKIAELAAIADPRVIKPEKLVYNESGKVLGFTSRYVASGGVLCQLFTRTFRDHENLSPSDVGALVLCLRSMIAHVHQANVLVVDLNEMNFLLHPSLKDVYAIDVASYQTPHFRATALMESVRDRHARPNEFSVLTDWFAFAVVSFRMMTGIHPYKGTHPTVSGLDARMLANLSVLNRDVRVPSVCYPFSEIPSVYLDWYRQVFELGKRLPPPAGFTARPAPVARPAFPLATALTVTEIGVFDGEILGVWEKFGHTIVATASSIYQNGVRIGPLRTAARGIGFTSGGAPVAVSVESSGPTFFDVRQKKTLACALAGSAATSYDGRIYVKSGDKIVCVGLMEAGGTILPMPEVVAHVLEHASKLLDGCVVQSLLGSTYVSAFPRAGAHLQVRVAELDGARIVDARYDGGVLMVLAARAGTYDRYILRVVDDATYDLRVVRDVTPTGLNFVTLESGVCVSLTEELRIEVFSARKDSTSLRVVEDPSLHVGMRLYRRGGKVVFASGEKLYSLSMR